jgi:hypothetical protein
MTDETQLTALEIADDIKAKAIAATQEFSDETKHIVKLMAHNLDVDIHNYFVSLIDGAAKKESGFSAEQLQNAANDLAKILSVIGIIINRHKNYIIHNDPDFDNKLDIKAVN